MVEDIAQKKKSLRKQIRQTKKEYTLAQKQELSKPIFETIEQLPEFINSKIILLYWSMDDEVFTHDFIIKWYKQKTILLPCVEGDDLILRQFTGMSSMVEGKDFGILEPKGQVFEDISLIDLMIIPGVAFDKSCNRMGRGRGFYDRLLQHTNCKKWAIAFDFQMVESVPTEEFDIKMDKVITTSNTYCK